MVHASLAEALGEALAREGDAGRLSHRLRVIIHERTPYRVVTEALFTAGQLRIGQFELCENACGGRTLVFDAPRPEERRVVPMSNALNLVAIIVTDGISVKGSGGNVAPGCNEVGPGVAIPRTNGNLDLVAFGSCIAKLKASNPAFASEDRATVVASAGIPFHEVMDVALTLQGPTKTLFPSIRFGVAR